MGRHFRNKTISEKMWGLVTVIIIVAGLAYGYGFIKGGQRPPEKPEPLIATEKPASSDITSTAKPEATEKSPDKVEKPPVVKKTPPFLERIITDVKNVSEKRWKK